MPVKTKATIHEFTIVLANVEELTPDLADALYEVFDDGTAGSFLRPRSNGDRPELYAVWLIRCNPGYFCCADFGCAARLWWTRTHNVRARHR